MICSAWFSENGTPKTGLSPTITIYHLESGRAVISGHAMTELGNGFYWYDYPDNSHRNSYAYICDSVTLTGEERYARAIVHAKIPKIIWRHDERKSEERNLQDQIYREDEEILELIITIGRRFVIGG